MDVKIKILALYSTHSLKWPTLIFFFAAVIVKKDIFKRFAYKL